MAKKLSKMDERYFSHRRIVKRGSTVVLRARPKRK